MMEYGQPLHAYDYKTIHDKKIPKYILDLIEKVVNENGGIKFIKFEGQNSYILSSNFKIYIKDFSNFYEILKYLDNKTKQNEIKEQKQKKLQLTLW